MWSGSFANLTSIFGESNIPTGMQAIFHGPVFTKEFEETKDISLFGSKARDAIHIFSRPFALVFDALTQTEHLADLVPVVAFQRGMEFGRSLDQTSGEAAMTLASLPIRAPIETI